MRLATEIWLLFVRNMRGTLRSPAWVLLRLFQPVCFLALFMPLLEPLATLKGFPPGGALNVYMPGLLVMLGMYSMVFVGFGLIGDLRSGLIERLCSTRVSRVALLLGAVLRDVCVLMGQSILLLALGWVFGMKADPLGVLVALALIGCTGVFIASCSYALALLLKNEQALGPAINFTTLPLLLLSGVMLPLTLGPAWLQKIAVVNPFFHAVNTARSLFNSGLAEQRLIAQGCIIMAVLAVIAVAAASRCYQRATS